CGAQSIPGLSILFLFATFALTLADGTFAGGAGAVDAALSASVVPGGVSVHPTTTAVATARASIQVRRRERNRMRVSRNVGRDQARGRVRRRADRTHGGAPEGRGRAVDTFGRRLTSRSSRSGRDRSVRVGADDLQARPAAQAHVGRVVDGVLDEL